MRRSTLLLSCLLIGVFSACGDDDTTTPEQSGQSNSSTSSNNSNSNDTGDNSSNENLIGPTTVSVAEGVSEPFTFQVPDGTARVGVMALGDMDYRFEICEWIQENGDVLIGMDENPIMCTNCIRNAISYGTAAAAAPFGSLSLVGGTHSVRVCSDYHDLFAENELNGTIEVTVALSPDLPPQEQGKVPISFHFASGLPWSADSAAEDPEFNTLVDEIQTIYAAADLELDVQGYYPLDRDVDPVEPLERWQFAQSLPHENAIPIVFVSRATSGGYLDGEYTELSLLFGESRLPGPELPGFGGAIFVSGGVSTSDIEAITTLSIPVFFGRVIAHELGHYFGLAHSTENELLDNHDTLADTLENDPNQLMFWKAGGVELSPNQITIMRSSPWVVYE